MVYRSKRRCKKRAGRTNKRNHLNTRHSRKSNKVKQYTPPTDMDNTENMRQNSFIKSPTQSSFTDRTNPPMNTFLSKESTYNNNFNNNNNDDYIEIIDKKDSSFLLLYK